MQTTAAASALIVHVTGGLVAILGGFGALALRKGSPGHRGAGLIFFWGMLIMAAGAAYVGYARSELNDVVTAVTIAYFVGTARWAIQGASARTRFLEVAALGAALVIVAANLLFARQAASGDGTLYGLPAMLYWISAAIVALAALLDLNFVLRGALPAKHRLIRHLWRMGFALWVAVASFFWGQMQVFPVPVRNFYLLTIPVLVVIVAIAYWLIRMSLMRDREARMLWD